MKEERSLILSIFGYFFILCWFADFINSAFLKNDLTWVLWYSTAGLLLTSFALITQNIKLIYSLFCALFVPETVWVLGAFYIIFSHKMFMGLNNFISTYQFTALDLYRIFYHAIIPTGLLIAVFIKKQFYIFGWLGAIIYASTVGILTAIFANPDSQLNCFSSHNPCNSFFSFLYRIGAAERIFTAIFLLSIFVFLPSNIILSIFKKRGSVSTSVKF